MIIYYYTMRQKDELKQDAIIKATVNLVNEIGFVASSVSKIAKQANVSPATIYIYYKNKEDLLVSTYVDIKKKMSAAMLRNFDENRPIRDIFKQVWLNTFEYISQHLDYFQFSEQFSYSPYSELVNKEEVEKLFEPLVGVVQKGIREKIIKDAPFDMLTVFLFYPVLLLSNPKLCKHFEASTPNIETAFTMAWDAVKL